jgi:hypothetical protein
LAEGTALIVAIWRQTNSLQVLPDDLTALHNTPARNDSLGSKGEKLILSKCCPVCRDKQTSACISAGPLSSTNDATFDQKQTLASMMSA